MTKAAQAQMIDPIQSTRTGKAGVLKWNLNSRRKSVFIFKPDNIVG